LPTAEFAYDDQQWWVSHGLSSRAPAQFLARKPGSQKAVLTDEKGCTNSQLVCALSSDDAGTLNVANALWEFGPDVVAHILGLDISQYNTTRDYSSNWN
jgi:hypothetical protein